ncbi:hypothetical protein HOLleu_05107 [Holothuria leucospilota]|uniref:Uncharacterized protein n=1 Tax=Holothuria leucospilota TaxID=206669 RepID=A0A9Q1CK86_HOLLE|nr:hypothetical protein HOLleu_05107 [Holothuria leucospilota]
MQDYFPRTFISTNDMAVKLCTALMESFGGGIVYCSFSVQTVIESIQAKPFKRLRNYLYFTTRLKSVAVLSA